MKNPARFLFFLLFFPALVPSLAAEDASGDTPQPLSRQAVSFLSQEDFRELRDTGILFAKPDAWDELQLVLPQLRAPFRREMKDIKPNVISEALMFVPSRSPQEDLLVMTNELLRVDRMDQIRFYNPEKELRRTLFAESYRVPARESGNSDSPRPRELRIFVYQNLKAIGPLVMEYSFRREGEGMEMKALNTTPLKKSVFTLIGEGNFLSRVSIVPVEGGFLLYGVGAVKLFNPFNVLGDKIDPFYYRIHGIFNWYQEEIVQPLLRRSFPEPAPNQGAAPSQDAAGGES